MKSHLPVVFGCLLVSGAVQALEFQTTMDTSLLSSEAAAYKAAVDMAKDIDRGTNDDAIGEASIECPEDNFPKFQVENIQVNTFWLPTSVSAEDKKYSGAVNYLIKCSHIRGGGDRR